ncbi:MAG: hypothetical protein A3H96_21750 [Acidobacteria bacterium RIFCSPLOWO2_02_FULL_67_36]|nr:MAG: hypothetical protein A3H96_21750 [Acidobacteria bacterium RIFCSPLOWO2_02_FULL_67_36]OFW20606.1 MAG: hypothetical protein A3G21_22045 [Acidobacteria bacterium RIFCSPLOWO2_12_FULL_66_21]
MVRWISALAVVTLAAAAACAHGYPKAGGGTKPLGTTCGQVRTINVTVDNVATDATIDPNEQPACAGDYVVWLIENPLGEEITVELRKFHEKGRPGNGKKLSFQGSNKRRVPSKYTVPALAQIPDDITPANTALIVKYTVRVTSNSGSHDTDPELQVDPPPDSMLGRLRLAPLLHVAPSQR